MGTLKLMRRHTTLIVFSLSLGASACFVACGSDSGGHDDTDCGDGGTFVLDGGFCMDAALPSTGGGGAGGTTGGGGGAGGTTGGTGGTTGGTGGTTGATGGTGGTTGGTGGTTGGTGGVASNDAAADATTDGP